jgi:hypothetical protein
MGASSIMPAAHWIVVTTVGCMPSLFPLTHTYPNAMHAALPSSAMDPATVEEPDPTAGRRRKPAPPPCC